MKSAFLIYPHQIYEDLEIGDADSVVLIEEPLFFNQYPFHRQKLMLHRASMRAFYEKLTSRYAGTRISVHYVECHQIKSTGDIVVWLQQRGITKARIEEPDDDYLLSRLQRAASDANLSFEAQPARHFLTPAEDIDRSIDVTKKNFFTQFYIAQRKRLQILVTEKDTPIGGKWSFDTENRKKLPKGESVPSICFAVETKTSKEARKYVDKHFPNAIGESRPLIYPYEHDGAAAWLRQFIDERFSRFGDYEDAISTREDFVFHSAISPMLNIGLISPQQIIDAVAHVDPGIGMNSTEGFLRQVIGWREYVRAVYHKLGRKQRTKNFWSHHRPMPKTFYTGETGIAPVDHVVRRVLRLGYCHHIERLMILGNFMLLCEIDPDDIYQWFMEFFVDSYDWVMVPNVYGMSQHADGGLITTKPYISGSSYVLRMSDFSKGSWCPIWDALYWRFMDKNRDFFQANPRMSVMTKQLDKMGTKLQEHHRIAEEFLSQLN
jgi:deoxyribodipyrimidine photolyase-related protein